VTRQNQQPVHGVISSHTGPVPDPVPYLVPYLVPDLVPDLTA
jgi:hypothetical protein